MSQIDNDEAIMFSCQVYEIGENAPYENVDILVNAGTRHKSTTQPSNESKEMKNATAN